MKVAWVIVGGTCALGFLPCLVEANVLLSFDDEASISSLSAQVMDKPRSAAGRRKNVWDADPPEPASRGAHYFLYGSGANGLGQPRADRPLGFNALVSGPGYTVTAQVLVRDGVTSDGSRFWLGIPTSSNPDNPENFYDLGALGYEEFGVARVQFTRNGGTLGQIGGGTDSPELAYEGARDSQGDFVRGVEHVRFFTSTVPGHDDDILRGSMSAVLPSGYVPGAFDVYEPGFLTFPSGTFSGEQVKTASVSVPEPASVAVLGATGLAMLRRRRRAS